MFENERELEEFVLETMRQVAKLPRTKTERYELLEKLRNDLNDLIGEAEIEVLSEPEIQFSTLFGSGTVSVVLRDLDLAPNSHEKIKSMMEQADNIGIYPIWPDDKGGIRIDFGVLKVLM